jgi:radical SAM superfamily enzyme YgiQ (UPF0313 family)
MLPRHWHLKLVDLNVEPLEDEDLRWADYVMLSAMLVNRESIGPLADRCHAHDKPIIAGGPLFTTSHESFPSIDTFVLGEAEELMPQLVDDMQRGELRATYAAATRPNMSLCPVPRWDLINLRHYVTMSVQFSRGCPFDCEFCDITAVSGRIPRSKQPAQIIAELDQLHQRGWRGNVFFVDDNFIGNRDKTTTLLHEMVAWRARTRTSMGFLTEASTNLADTPEMCELMVRAGFRKIFVGFETPAIESLQECGKLQNCRRDMSLSVATLQRAGLEVMGGFIVGFDSDPRDIFHRQFEFIQQSGVVTAMVGLLTALPGTRLYDRLRQEGRLESESNGNNTAATLNFRPKIDRQFLTRGYRELMQKLYEPRHYYRRIQTFLKQSPRHGSRLRLSWSELKAFVKSLWHLGICHRGRVGYWRLLLTTALRRPRQVHQAMELAILGYHFRRIARSL